MEEVKSEIPGNSPTYQDESTSSSDDEMSSPVRRRYDDKDELNKPAAQTKQMDVNSFADFMMHGVNKAAPSQAPSSRIGNIPSFGIKDEMGGAVDSGTESLSIKSPTNTSKPESIASPTVLSPQTARPPVHDRAKVAPAAPRSRHGKSLPTPTAAAKGPQTVSFDSFTATIEDKSPRSISESESGNFNPNFTPSISSASRTNSHSSASLPSLNLPGEHTRRFSTDSRTSISLAPSTPTDNKKSAPPPVPIARRSTVKRNRADTASSNTSQIDNTIVPSTPTTAESISSLQKVAAAPPPPPPTRRHGSASTIPQTPSSQIPRSQDQTVPQPTSSSRTRSASGSSYITAPPPPPPARRRSSRHSIDTTRQNVLAPGSGPSSRRTSTDLPRSSFDSQRWLPSELAPQSAAIEEENRVESSAVSPVTPGASSEPQVDILADMEALQKEIDDLRARTQP